jgi:class 3 adenylate cyclase
MFDLDALSMTEIIRLQNQLQQALARRFERQAMLVFSDIVGSTAYFARFGDAAGRQLQQLHLDLLTGFVEASGGRIVDTAGDGVFMAFASAESAVHALIDCQQAMATENAARGRQHQFQVRIGMHWGPVLTDGVAVSGDAVNLCARVASSADIGEIRLTRSVFHELERDHRISCRPLGLVPLRDFDSGVDLLALDWRDETLFPCSLRVEETGERIVLPGQDIVSFGRLHESDGVPANDVVLQHPEPALTRRISRWHFELRRFDQGLHLHALSDSDTLVDGLRVEKGVPVLVRAGSRIRVADALTLHLLGASRPSQNADADATLLRVIAPPIESTGPMIEI